MVWLRRYVGLLGCVVLVGVLLQVSASAQRRPNVVVIPIVERPMWAAKRANLRIGPGTSFDKVGLLEVGQEVRITGEAGRWLRVELSNGRTAFVYGPLLSTRPAADEPRADPPGTEAPDTRRRHQLAQQERRVITYSHGRYEGEVRDGKRHGQGIMTGLDGHRYEGEWRNDRRHGRGTYTWPDGTRYEGKWRSGRHHGQGSKEWSGGDRYEGGWRVGKRHGQGTYTWSDGTRYEGEWNNSKRHGRGTYVSADGTIGEGKWRNDRMVRRSEPPRARRQRPAAAKREAPPADREYWGAFIKDSDPLRDAWGVSWNAHTPKQALDNAITACRKRYRDCYPDEPDEYSPVSWNFFIFSTFIEDADRGPYNEYPVPAASGHISGYSRAWIYKQRCIAVFDDSANRSRPDYRALVGNTQEEAAKAGKSLQTSVDLPRATLLALHCNER